MNVWSSCLFLLSAGITGVQPPPGLCATGDQSRAFVCQASTLPAETYSPALLCSSPKFLPETLPDVHASPSAPLLSGTCTSPPLPSRPYRPLFFHPRSYFHPEPVASCLELRPSQRSQSTGSSGQERGLKRKKIIRQHCSMTPASSEAEVGLFFPNLLLYHFNYMQVIRSVLG